MMYAYNTDLDMFAWQQQLGYGPHFNHHMGGYRQGRPPWMASSFYPVQERLVEGLAADKDAVLLVDIGGSVGHDLAQFRDFHPSAPGRLILQDLPVVIGQIKDLNPAIERMPYDFHTEQPVKGGLFSFYLFTPYLAILTEKKAPARTTCTRYCMTGRTTCASRSSAGSRRL